MELQIGSREALQQIMVARYYSSSLGRFLNTDPADESVDLEQPQTWNRYTYVQNNPINMVDPDGSIAIAIPLVWGAMAAVTALAVEATVYLNSPSATDPTRTNAEALAGSIVAATDQFATHFISRKSAQDGAASSLKVALAHITKMAGSNPNSPDWNPWKSSIKAAIKNIERMMDRMGPAARQKWIEILKELRERLQGLEDSGGSSNPALAPPPNATPTGIRHGGTKTAPKKPIPRPGGKPDRRGCPGGDC